MKIKCLLSIALLAYCVAEAAQYVTPPLVFSLLDGLPSTPFICNGGGTAPGPSTNLVGLAVVKPFPIGSGGYGMSINCSGTNATTTTNLTITIEYSGDGINWATNNRMTWIVTPLGVQCAPFFTNNPQTHASGVMGNCALGRILWLHHTNTGSIFITNLNVSTRLDAKSKRR